MPLAVEHVARSAASAFITTCPLGSFRFRVKEAVLDRRREMRALDEPAVPKVLAYFPFVAPAARRSALLLPLGGGPEQKLERGPRRSLTWPVVYVVEVDRLGRRFHALVTGGAAGGLGIQPLDRRVAYMRCRADEVVGHWGEARAAAVCRGAARAVGSPA
jgi:hypothetical protein